MSLHQANIAVHIGAGIIGLLVGILPYASQKGGKLHRQSGTIFLFLMWIVVLTALNGVFFFRSQSFLTVVSFQSFYYIFSGYRVTKVRDEGYKPIDLAVQLLVLGVVGWFCANLSSLGYLWNKGIVLYMLAYLGGMAGFDLLRYLFPNWINMQKFWLYEHIYKLTSAWAALGSAGAGTVLVAFEPWNQIIPAVIGTWWLVFCLVYFPRMQKRKQVLPQIVVSPTPVRER